MTVRIESLRPYLQAFEFQSLFVEELGWNQYVAEPLRVGVDNSEYALEPVAEKAEFVVYVCGPAESGEVAPYPVRRKVESQVAKRAYEHLVIFVDARETTQIWQWVKREAGSTARYREFPYRAGAPGDSILQRLRGLAFTLEDEASGIEIVDVTAAARRAFDVEKVTKSFYRRFRSELAAFTDFIQGISAQGDRDWYASLMLNRMMFIYFVQKQGFLDGDPDYLRNRLNNVRSLPSPPMIGPAGSRFHDFYRLFLRRLFHEGLGQPEARRNPDLAALLGRVPFLNGGLFEEHDLEKENPDIRIPDEAFERLFAFFDGYRWHLDERPRQADNEINPDVLGHIFEKYVNQKQMGAYYTKEDVTGYITRNAVVPFLIGAARGKCPVAFGRGGGVWRLLREDPDRYMYPAVGHGVAWDLSGDGRPKPLPEPRELPSEIAAGLGDVSKRESWNTAAPATHALPTETWREVVARRQRHAEVRGKLSSGTVREVAELVTLNLDIERFAQDVIVQSEGPELLRAFWHSLRDLTVLDPTCGSGAFLFAALNVLEPLYTFCLEGMRGFLEDLDRSERRRSPRALSDFREVLAQVESHPSERYFILKSIVLNNLYGVDIMEEAVEICKLRLFLKLVAQLESYDQIEPLPDIDFNVRAGNTLVGFTSLEAVQEAMAVREGAQRIRFAEEQADVERIREDAEVASRAFDRFREQQTTLGGEITGDHKEEIRGRLRALAGRLDLLLAGEHGVDATDGVALEAWRRSHKPFHWFAEFYGIMAGGERNGFDVAIGNPPYIRGTKVDYATKGLATAGCPDIYAQIVERSANLVRHRGGLVGMILPLSLTFGGRFESLRELLFTGCSDLWFSSFGRIPSALFSFDVRVRNTILLGRTSRNTSARCLTTRLHRWFKEQRSTLFQTLSYSEFSPESWGGLVPKLGSARLLGFLEALLRESSYRLNDELAPTRRGLPLFFKKSAYNWLTFCVDLPPAFGLDGAPVPHTKYGTAEFLNEANRDLSLLLANGKLMFLWWACVGDDFDVTRSVWSSVPFGPRQLSPDDEAWLLSRAKKLERAMSQHVVFKRNAGKDIGNYNLARCRGVTDQADAVWLNAAGGSDLWGEVELEYVRVVRTDFD